MNRIAKIIDDVRSKFYYRQPVYVPGYEYAPWKKWVIIFALALVILLIVAGSIGNNKPTGGSGDVSAPTDNAHAITPYSDTTTQALTPSTAQTSVSAGGIVKMSNSGICHAPGDVYYDRTIHYTSYPSMQACVDAGGRPSER